MLRNCAHDYNYHESFHDKEMELLKIMTIVTNELSVYHMPSVFLNLSEKSFIL